MIRPQDTETREKRMISGLWRFCFDPDDLGEIMKWYAKPLPQVMKMSVCTSYNDIFAERQYRNYVGAVWYQTDIRLPVGWSEKDCYLYFESITHNATVWLGDKCIATHRGGYTPFEASLAASPQNLSIQITIRVDNRLSNETIPPGKLENTPFGKKQTYWHDFFNYAGIHRPIWLCSRNKTHIQDIRISPSVNGTTGLLNYEVKVQGDQDITMIARTYDEQDKLVAEQSGLYGTLQIVDANLWDVRNAYLYTTEFRLIKENETVDHYCLRSGIRTLMVDGNRLLLNGKAVYFKGFGMHEDIEILGKGHNDAYMLHDFELLKWIGANSFRTSHYPYSEDVMDYADEQGFLVIDETPAVGLNMVGDSVFSGDEQVTFSPVAANDITRENHANAIRELIDRDKNHPCVVIWSIANEPETITEGAQKYFEPLFQLTRELDSSRPVGFAGMVHSKPEMCRITQYADLLMLNRYYGWYTEIDRLPEAQSKLCEELKQWELLNKPILFTEFGADTLSGLHSETGAPWTEEYQAEILKMYFNVFDALPCVIGEQIWNFADFQTASGISRLDGNRKGLFTRSRRPKLAAHFVRERWRLKK